MRENVAEHCEQQKNGNKKEIRGELHGLQVGKEIFL